MASMLRKVEAGVAVLLTLAVIWLHFIAATSEGALWRDEANTVGLATLPTLGDVWRNLQYDSFPILWVVIVREFAAVVGPTNDPAFRALGFCVGAAVVASLWFNAQTFRHSFPLLSLALLGMSPSLILWGDSIRAYGFGIFLILITGPLLWRFVEQPSAPRFVAASAGAIASVHTLFYNSVLLLAFCAGAVAVCAQKRALKSAALVLLIGALPAISLAPYAVMIRNAGSWNALVRMPDYSVYWFYLKLDETLRPAGSWAITVWFQLFVLAVVIGLIALVRHRRVGLSPPKREAVLFSVVTLVVGVPALFFFLDVLSYYTQPWYYLALLALVAVCIDSLFGALIDVPTARIVRIAIVLLIAGATFFPAVRAVRTRLTNVDLVASRLRQIAQPDDFVLVYPWYNGVSFDRYYGGPAPWVTIPPIAYHRFHRYDLLKQRMMAGDQTAPIRPATDKAGEALRMGHRVFVVGGLEFPPAGERPKVLPAAPLPGDQWPEPAYNSQWSSMVGYFLQLHAATLEVVQVRTQGRVSRYENLPLLAARGWRP
jgi:hypothetical protein